MKALAQQTRSVIEFVARMTPSDRQTTRARSALDQSAETSSHQLHLAIEAGPGQNRDGTRSSLGRGFECETWDPKSGLKKEQDEEQSNNRLVFGSHSDYSSDTGSA